MARKKTTLSVTSEWGNLVNKAAHLSETDPKKKAIYRVEPVDLDTFVNSPEYLNQGMWGGMSDSQREFIEHGTDMENGITFLVLWIGKGAGKNWSTGILFLYIIYKLLCMYDPHGYLDHNPAKAITLLNVAINANQAKKNFFDPMVNILKNSGDKAFRAFGFNPDTDIQTTQVIFPKNIEVISGNSKGGGVEGFDLLLAVADEVDDVEFHGVDKVLDTLRTSAQSRFEGKEKIITISYQRYVGSSGKISELYHNALGHDHIFARRYASWEFHPKRTRESFQTYYDENPEKAACIYGSEMTGSFVDSWIKDSMRIKNAMNWEREWILDWPLPYDPDPIGSEKWISKVSHHEWKNAVNSEFSYRPDDLSNMRILDPYDIPIRVHGDPNKIYVLCGDPALGSDANGGDGYGVTLGHRVMVERDGLKFVRPVVDFSFRFTGRMFEEGQVQMVALEYLIKKLKERYGYNIKYFSFDGWNSSSLTQWIARTYPGVIVRDRNLVKTQDYTALRDAIFGEAPPSNGKGGVETNGGIDMPWHPIVFEELRQLREDRKKKTVDHTETSSKDIADTIAKLVYITVNEWPFTEMSLHTAGAPNTPITTHRDTGGLGERVANNTATDEERKVYYEAVNSNVVGLGSFRR